MSTISSPQFIYRLIPPRASKDLNSGIVMVPPSSDMNVPILTQPSEPTDRKVGMETDNPFPDMGSDMIIDPLAQQGIPTPIVNP